MKYQTRNRERGVALFFSIFALLLLTAIGAAMIFMASTETTVNSNYRQEQMAYFAAKAGIEEARARMMESDPNSVACGAAGSAPCAQALVGNASYPLFDTSQITAANPPSTSNHMIYYITNPGSGTAVQPWNPTNQYFDDELCHDDFGAAFGGTTATPDIRCASSSLPTGSSWYESYTSTIPFNGTAAALPYKWVRIEPKLNSSISYLSGTGSTPTTQYYAVDAGATGPTTVNGVVYNVPITASSPICWDGAEEVPLTTTTLAAFPAITPPIANCSEMTSSVTGYSGAQMTNVYVVTALGVSPGGARKVVQADVALQPTVPFPYGLYATSTACPAITFTGNNPSTNSYTTAGGQTYASSQTNTGGDIGSNGGVNVGNGNIGGIVGVLQPPPAGNGTCATPVTVGPNGTMVGSTACPSANSAQCYVPQPYVFPTPPIPNPIPPNTSYTPPNCSGGHGHSGQCISPGTYGNISITGTLTMAPGIYNINSLSMTGNAAIVVSPPGALTFNVGGCGDATCSVANQLANPLAIAGNGVTDDSNPNDFTINYAGSGTVSVAGNGDVTAILNSPNARITQQGNGNWYGSILGSTVTLGGNAFFHYDRASALAPANNGYFTLVGYHEVPY